MGLPPMNSKALLACKHGPRTTSLALEAATPAAHHFWGCIEGAGLSREEANDLWRRIEEQRLILEDLEVQFLGDQMTLI